MLPVALLVSRDPSCKVIHANAAGRALFRTEPGRDLSREPRPGAAPPGFVIYADGRPVPTEQLPLHKAAATGRPVPDFEGEVRFADGSVTTIAGRSAPLFDREGKVCASIAAFVDISRRAKLEEQNRLLLNELSHRVKNTVAIIQAISRQTIRPLVSERDFKSYEQRLVALAAAHDLLFGKPAFTAKIHDVAETTMNPIAGLALSRIDMHGPDLHLDPQVALTLSMILHELGTNACKYGALSQPGGRLDISWDLAPAGKGALACVRWKESGGPPVRAPAKTGFGTKLLDISVKGMKGGTVKVNYEPQGLSCDITLPCAVHAPRPRPN
jgi:two-component system CheB/CheR fusion protein